MVDEKVDVDDVVKVEAEKIKLDLETEINDEVGYKSAAETLDESKSAADHVTSILELKNAARVHQKSRKQDALESKELRFDINLEAQVPKSNFVFGFEYDPIIDPTPDLRSESISLIGQEDSVLDLKKTLLAISVAEATQDLKSWLIRQPKNHSNIKGKVAVSIENTAEHSVIDTYVKKPALNDILESSTARNFEKKLSITLESGKKSDKECHLAKENVDQQEFKTTFEILNRDSDGQKRRKETIGKQLYDAKAIEKTDEKGINDDEKEMEDDENMKTQDTMKKSLPMKVTETRKN